jgi:hypothetical protein
MAQTIVEQVAELTGAGMPPALDDWANDAINLLYDILPPTILLPLSTLEVCDYGAGGIELTANNKVIFEVMRSASGINRICQPISPGDYLGKYADSDSMHYPTDYDPVWTKYTDTITDTIKVLPAAAGMIVYARTIAYATTYVTSNTTISTLPVTAEYLVVLDLAGRVVLYRIQGLTLGSLAESLVVPATPSAPAFVYTDAAAAIVDPSTLSVLSVPPSFTKPTLGSSVAMTPTAVVPTAPTLATVMYTTASGAVVSPTTVGTIPAVPTFTPGVLPGMVLAASTAFDAALVEDDIETAQSQIAKLNQGMQQYQTIVQENLTSFNKDLEKYKSDIQKVFTQAQLTAQEAQVNAKLATDVAMQNAIQSAAGAAQSNASLLNAYQTQVQAYGQLINAEVQVYSINMKRVIDIYQSDIQNESQRVGTAVQVYQAAVQGAIKQLDVAAAEAQTNAQSATTIEIKNHEQQLARQIQEYQSGLKLYETELGAYAQQLQSRINTYQSNIQRNKLETDRFLALAAQFKQEYQMQLLLKFGINLKGSTNGKQG